MIWRFVNGARVFGRVGIGGAEYESGTTTALFVDSVGHATSGVLRGVHARTIQNDNAGSAGSASTAIWGEAQTGGSVALSHIVGGQFYASHKGSGALDELFGVNTRVFSDKAGTITDLYGYYAAAPAQASATNSYGLYIEDWNGTGGGATSYAIYTGTGTVRFGGALRVEARGTFKIDDQNVTLDTPSTGQTSALYFSDAGNAMWAWLKSTTNTLRLYSFAAAAAILTFAGNGAATFANTVSASGFLVGASAGVDGSFTTTDGKTVTVTKGIITGIAA